MAQWPTAPGRPSRWRAAWPVLAMLVVALLAYMYVPQLLQRESAVPPEALPDSVLIPLSPGLYGSPATTLRIPGVGEGLLVEPLDPSAPVAVLLAATDSARVALAGMQAMFERQGIASLVLPVSGDTAAVGALLDWVEVERIRRGQRVSVVIPGGELERFLTATSGRTGHEIVVLGAPPAAQSFLASVLSRLPRALQPAAATADPRLGAWEEATVVVAADSQLASARRLALGAGRGVAVVLREEPLTPPSVHPDMQYWRAVLGRLTGREFPSPEVLVGGDSLVFPDAPLRMPLELPRSGPSGASSTPPPRIQPPPPPSRR